MPRVNELSTQERVDKGDSLAEEVRAYLNHLIYGGQEVIQKASFDADVRRKIDWIWEQLTLQAKCRDEREDIICETHLFYLNGVPIGTPIDRIDDGSTFTRAPGRDIITEADLYVLKPGRTFPEEIYICNTLHVKRFVNNAIEQWRVDKPEEARLSDETICKLWNMVYYKDRPAIPLYTSTDGVTIYFQIEKGSNRRPPYCKILCYVKLGTLTRFRKFVLRNNELLNKSETWL